jgi:hypothetical protein
VRQIPTKPGNAIGARLGLAWRVDDARKSD